MERVAVMQPGVNDHHIKGFVGVGQSFGILLSLCPVQIGDEGVCKSDLLSYTTDSPRSHVETPGIDCPAIFY